MKKLVRTLSYQRFLRIAGIDTPVIKFGLPMLMGTLALQWSTRRKVRTAAVQAEHTRNNKTFTLMDPKNKIDLGLTACVSFGLPTIARCIETIFILRIGLRRAMNRESPMKHAAIFYFVVFGIFPTIDLLLGDDWTNPTEQQMRAHVHDKKFRSQNALVIAETGLILAL